MDRVSEEEDSVNQVRDLRQGWGGSDRVDPRKEYGFQSSVTGNHGVVEVGDNLPAMTFSRSSLATVWRAGVL